MSPIWFVVLYFVIGVGAWAEGRYNARGYALAVPKVTITLWPVLVVVGLLVVVHEWIEGLGDRIAAAGERRRAASPDRRGE